VNSTNSQQYNYTHSPVFHGSISDRCQQNRSMERRQISISVDLSWSACRARTQIDLKAIRPWKDERSIWEVEKDCSLKCRLLIKMMTYC